MNKNNFSSSYQILNLSPNLYFKCVCIYAFARNLPSGCITTAGCVQEMELSRQTKNYSAKCDK